jgi:hypothetical protein
MPTTNWLKTLLIPLIIILLVLAGFVVPKWWAQGRPECPHDWNFGNIRVPIRDTKETVALQTQSGPNRLSASGAQTNVPEFNDCQRLILGTGGSATYGSLYAVFAWDRMDDSLDHAPLNNGLALPMVEILSVGGTYDQLSIKPGLSCLFVFKKSDTWVAMLVEFGAKEGDCHSPRPLGALPPPHAELAIKRTSYPGLKWYEYPAVARWEWDTVSNTQVIGFKCLDGWYEVGELGHPPDTGPDLTSTMSGVPGLAGEPVLRVKGWYDQQRLSPTAAHWWSSGAGPTSVVGTIIPVPGLDRFDIGDFSTHWQLIAFVNLSEASAEYEAQQRFVPMTRTKLTTISLCSEQWASGTTSLTGEGCPGISPALRQAAKCVTEPGAPTRHWWAQTIRANNPDPWYWCIVRRSAPLGVPVPGTARWRWLASDETTWGRCGGACCSGH